MNDDAFHGLAGDVIRRIEPHTESDPAALLVQFLIAFGKASDSAVVAQPAALMEMN